MRIWLRRLGGLVMATLVALPIASLAHSHFVQRELAALGVDIPLGTRLLTALRDLVGLAPAFGAVIFLALLIGFLLAGLIRRRWPVSPWIAFPLAGFAALATALLLMLLQFSFAPIAGARTVAGFAAISFAGAIGGLVFAWFARSAAR